MSALRIAATALALVLAAAAPARAAPPARGLIDRIEIEGVRTLDAEAVEATLEIGAGDPPEELRIGRSARNLQGAYQARGFADARVGARLRRERDEDGRTELVLAFTVHEGLPTRVAAVRFVPRNLGDRRLNRYWESVAGRLNEEFPIAVGDRVDQDRVAAARRAIQDALASEEFIGGGIEEVRVGAQRPPALAARPDEGEARWVDLEFRMDLGERVSFGFRGNAAVPWFQLQSLIDEQRLVGFGNDYLGALRARIEDEYRARGYALARVESLTFEREERAERHVTFVIDEGPRTRVDSIEFEGNREFPAERLRAELLNRAADPVPKGIYVEKAIEQAALLTAEWMRAQGHLAAKLLTISREYRPATASWRVTVYFYEGERTLVQEVRLEGFRALDPAEARRLLKIESGRPFDPFAFSEGIEALKQRYRALGYLDAYIRNEAGDDVVRYSQENRAADIRIEMDEGFQFRAGRVEISGLERTRREVVERQLGFREGEVLEEGKLRETEASLRKLGIFANVDLQLADDTAAADRKRVRVLLQEGTPGLVAGGLGFRTDLGARVFGQTSYSNLFRRNHTLLLNGAINQRFDRFFCDNDRTGTRDDYQPAPGADLCDLEYQIQLGYLWPWFSFGDTTFRPLFTIERSEFFQFDATSRVFALTWERPLSRRYNATALFTYSLEYVSQKNAIEEEVDAVDLAISGITPALRVDLRDSPLAPTRGLFALLSYEWAAPELRFARGSTPVSPQVGYTRFQMRTDYHLPLTRDVSWYVSFRTGFARNLEPPPDSVTDRNQRRRFQIPLIKQFTLGGAGSMRGFQLQEINRSDQSILGTISYVNYRTHLDLPFSGPLRFVPFLDAGNVHVDRYTFGNLRFGTGAGLHYMSPVGPVNLDLGFKVGRRPWEDLYNVYFSIGVL